ncbi:hypothetical protein [Maritimibacter sp. DP1N21-5]|uniref:hypothetical protein n=1 Tax=Maritimibacter sp. DP1N21-5 TaxID=2836867 RepID=UPI001C47B252|nr:hypothetical protein [Maritimibacter sp. DP1N21-5]MBV7409124.1 hypothetical protein [Maritimibacter sp. DP1N21-5]
MRLALLLSCLAVPLHAGDVSYRFLWEGSGGYSMRGAMAFDEGMLEARAVFEGDLSCFVIEGYENGTPIGRWALGMLTEETSWQVTFLPRREEFVVYAPETPAPQAWNMNGIGDDCGPGGFGFNIGNQAQDLCLDGEWVWESQIDPARPFPVVRDDEVAFPADACRGDLMMSELHVQRVD